MAYGQAGHHPMTAASTNSRCSATSSAPAARPAPVAQRSPPAAPRLAHPAQHTRHNPGQVAAERAQAMIITSRPAVSKPARSAGCRNHQRGPGPSASAASAFRRSAATLAA
jgi:hypothetical protein